MKKAVYAVAALVLLGAAGTWLAFNYADVGLKWAIEHYGSQLTGTSVQVADVELSPRDGRGRLRRLEIANPQGFSSRRAVRLGDMRVALDPATLTAEVVHIREIVVESAEITYEKAGKRSNLDAIQQSIERYAASGDARGRSAGARTTRRRYVIDRVVIRGTRVFMTNAALRGQGVEFTLPDLQLADIGKREGGVTASEAAATVAGAMQQRIAQKLLTNLELLRRGGVEGAVDALKGLLK